MNYKKYWMDSRRNRPATGARFNSIGLMRTLAAFLLLAAASQASAQDVRWSWFEISYVQQEIDRQGSMTDLGLGQTVDVNGQDGNGIKFRASFGTWKNLFAFVDFNSSDIDVDAVVTNAGGVFPASDEFDYTQIRGGVGVKWSIGFKTDLYGAISYDSTDFDFGSFAGEDFDAGESDVGGEIGLRTLLGDKFEVRIRGRHTSVGDVNFSTGEFDSDTLYGIGFGYEVVRGFSVIGDFESGEFSSWNIGFRMDLSEE